MRSLIPPGLFSGLVLPPMQSTPSPSRHLGALCALLLLPATAAHAQVVTNSQALDDLGGSATHQAQSAPKTTQQETERTPTRQRAAAQKPAMEPPLTSAPAQQQASSPVKPQATERRSPAPASSSVSKPTAQTAPSPASGKTEPQAATTKTKPAPGHTPPSPTIPPAPPAEPQLTPAPPDVELHPFPVPPQPAVDLKAVGKVSTIPGGVRLTFAAGSAALNPETHQAILAFGQLLSDKPHVRAHIDAYSSGAADDPSLPRRMALARGLAARSVLMNGGTPSTRIYLRTIGVPKTPATDGGQDYIDIYQSDAAP